MLDQAPGMKFLEEASLRNVALRSLLACAKTGSNCNPLLYCQVVLPMQSSGPVDSRGGTRVAPLLMKGREIGWTKRVMDSKFNLGLRSL